MFYGHYDVQPVDPLNLWESEPFIPTIRDNKLFARGASDDKGQVFMHLKMIEALFATTGTLPVNVKFIYEGEEEIGSPHLPSFVEEYKEKLASDLILISDTGLYGLVNLQYAMAYVDWQVFKLMCEELKEIYTRVSMVEACKMPSTH